MKYEPVRELGAVEIVQVLNSPNSSVQELISAALSAVSYHDTDFAVDCVLNILKCSKTKEQAREVVEELMQSHRSSHRSNEFVDILTKESQSNEGMRGTLAAVLEFERMFPDVVR
jgi:tRNA A-37 threonylcarbamoyl transferase component Bud32